MLGSTNQELGAMAKVENEQRRREQIMREHVFKGTRQGLYLYDRHITHGAERSQPSLGALRGCSEAQQLIHLPQIGTSRTPLQP